VLDSECNDLYSNPKLSDAGVVIGDNVGVNFAMFL